MENNGHVVLTSSISGGAMGIHDHALYNSSKMAVKGMIPATAHSRPMQSMFGKEN